MLDTPHKHTMSEKIRHAGKIEKILDKGHIQVRIVQTSACQSCKMSGHCLSSESKEKIVDVWTDDANKFTPGENVTVTASMRTGIIAVILGFVAPSILLLLAVVITLHILPESAEGELPINQAYAALAGIGILIPYYIILYCIRGYMRGKLTFGIEQLNI